MSRLSKFKLLPVFLVSCEIELGSVFFITDGSDKCIGVGVVPVLFPWAPDAEVLSGLCVIYQLS